MDEFRWDVASSLEQLATSSTMHPALISVCRELLAKQIWTPADRQLLLSTLARHFLHPQCSAGVAAAFRPALLDVLERAGQAVHAQGRFWLERHEQLCVALGSILTSHPDAFRFLMKYLQTSPPVFERLLCEGALPKGKKKKKGKDKEEPPAPSLSVILRTCHRFLEFSADAFADLWDWSPLFRLVGHKDLAVRWHSLHVVAALTRMADRPARALFSSRLAAEEVRRWTVAAGGPTTAARPLTRPAAATSDSAQPHGQGTHTMRELASADMSPSVAAVCGVLLMVKSGSNNTESAHPLVQVPSTSRNLRSLALAVSSGTAVLLEGAVGCGKSALVQHLAHATGRAAPPGLLKVQLGDQTDSKALIGTYRCTDIPGEFVWQPGALTQAVTSGNWILLEDIDYAPMDVVSVLVPLLEAGSLTLPGHGDVVRAAPGFQLFATQRLLTGAGGFYRQRVSHAALLDRLWSKVNLEPLSREELQQIVVTLHPQLSPVVDKLLDIFCMLSSGSHGDAKATASADDIPLAQHACSVTPEEVTGHQGRLISTRDLLKWCGRIASGFNPAQTNTANQIFLEAMDCFCAALHKPATRSRVAEAVGVRLGLSLEKCAFFCRGYKPSLDVQRSEMAVGRARLSRKADERLTVTRVQLPNFAFTRPASVLLERVAVCIGRNEPVLLVGETGTGKTSAVQYLASVSGQRLKVVNMNQQSDSTDLLGGFKPVDIRQLVAPLREDFEGLFVHTFSRKQNVQFLVHLQECFAARRWSDLLRMMGHCHKAAVRRFEKADHDEEDEGSDSGKQSPTVRNQWRSIGERIQTLTTQLRHADNALAFSFVEGTLVQAVRNGDWVLLDEINLATAETLECLSGLLESSEGTLTLLERGDSEPITRHKDFRLFACMNPATDVGKKELPPGIRNRFTEFYVDELEEVADLKILVSSYLRGLALPPEKLDGIVQFYLAVRKEAENKLADGTGHRPHYSLRTLCRALRYASSNPCGNVMRSLYESFCLSFLTQLDRASHPLVEQLVCKKLIGRAHLKGLLGQPIPPPLATSGRPAHVKTEGYWIAAGDREPERPRGYVLTPAVRANLRDLARVVSAGTFPVLLQGETSVGKTSLIQYLAQATGNHCVRVNNHEHTDLQEYVGFYAADETGKLVFKEGVLVNAMRKGHWVILDELNLAPSDVLEALNRLLDDNRELYIAETQEMVSAHPRFVLFATQNPPGQYGGRKVLSRAFRNRFVELHFDEIPSKELETILHQRCAIPPSYCHKMVAVMLDLQLRRKGSGVFSGKQGFITLRDLFRWAERYRRASQGQGTLYDWDQHIADDGYLLLAGRIRRPEEESLIQEVLERHIRCRIQPSRLFDLGPDTSPLAQPLLERAVLASALPDGFGHVVWTRAMRRLVVLVGRALQFQEPVLLVGDTGCGKTTICQLHAALAGQRLYTVNCHLHTETSDFLGGLRPVRQQGGDKEEDQQKLFEWCDGPLVLAMRQHAAFLLDEISLADDSVLERLNSVLEPERTLLLAERGNSSSSSSSKAGDGDADLVVAGKQFFVAATMNPGGDFGKKELSPALRNRFTEIWCPASTDRRDLVSIIEQSLAEGAWLCNQEDGSSGVGHAIMDFVEWFQSSPAGKRCTVSIRDVLSWVRFINSCCERSTGRESLDTALAYVHGACMVFLDGLGSGTTSNSGLTPHQARSLCLDFLHGQVLRTTGQDVDLATLTAGPDLRRTETQLAVVPMEGELFGIHPFYIPRGPLTGNLAGDQYALNAPTTALNALRVLRGLQLHRPVLLEGSPGVGKTSLVSAIAKASGHELVRINLSEQTDVTDLFGADLPVEGGEGGQFAWRDGPLLRALKGGHWVVLDELNLASQSVLEGLNACLDHRAEVYVPELGRTFRIRHEETRLFACQNPLRQGGGRKGLPRSFLNRFTQVYVEPLTSGDLLFITHSMYPAIDQDLLEKMVTFNNQIYQETMVECQWGHRGGPWEFNLRDLFRWCDLMVQDQSHGGWQPGQHVGLIYRDRMRSQQDKCKVHELFKTVFGDGVAEAYEGSRQVHITPQSVQVGHSFLRRREHVPSPELKQTIPLQLLHHSLDPLESLMKCLQLNWMAILVGPSASGKTALVHTLARLIGHRVRVLAMNSAMDTTELLGGFEQADLNRHMEKALQSLRQVVMATGRLLLAQEGEVSQHASQLLASWSALRTMCETGTVGESGPATPGSEGDLTARKLDMYEQVLEQVRSLLAQCGGETAGLEAELNRVASLAAELRRRLSTESGSAQLDSSRSKSKGTFEWVDGMLVQALRDGDWLLIDNVNFCSPSVLDCLNALLEPNGVLRINERGSIDGHIPTIRPHPDFRLILAMDPRHGEISRAMRNRGVEIYILGEDEGGRYDRLDLLALLAGMGLTADSITDPLLKLHQDIKLGMPGSDIAGLPSLLLAASLTAQLLERGRSAESALSQACSEVFVRGQLSKVNREKALEIVSRHVGMKDTSLSQLVPDPPRLEPISEGEEDEADAFAIEGALRPGLLPSVDELSRHASWAIVGRQTAVLRCLLAQLTKPGDQPVTASAVVPLIRPAVLLLLEQATATDWQLRRDWLLSAWRDWLPSDREAGAVPTGAQGAEFVGGMPGVALATLGEVFEHPLSQRLAEILQRIASWEDGDMLEHYPADLSQAPQFLSHLATLGQKRAADRMEADGQLEGEGVMSAGAGLLDDAVAVARRLHLVLRITATRHLDYAKLKLAVDTKHKPTTAIQLSYALHQGMMGVDDLPHPILAHIYPFFKSLDEFLSDLLSADQPALSEEESAEILLAVGWRDRCWQACDRPIQGRDSFHLGQFALHWGWLCKRTLAVVPRLLLGNNNSLPSSLDVAVQRISDQLSIRPGRGLAAPGHQRALSQALGRPLPYKTGRAAATSLRLRQLAEALDVAGLVAGADAGRPGKRRRRKMRRCVDFLVRDAGAACRKLTELLLDVAELNSQAVDEDDDDLLDSIQGLEASLVVQGLLPREGSSSSGPVPMETETAEAAEDAEQPPGCGGGMDVASQVGVWPLYEQASLSAELGVANDLLATKLKGEERKEIVTERLSAMLEYTLSHTPSSPLRLLPYAALLRPSGLARGDDPAGSEVAGSLAGHLWTSPATSQLPLWLSWRQHQQSEADGMSEGVFSGGGGGEVDFEDMPHGPALLHTPLQTLCVTRLLHGPAQERPRPPTKAERAVAKGAGSRVAGGVPLGQHLEKVEQLGALSALLWSTSSLSLDRFSFRTNSIKHLALTLCQLLQSLEPLLPTPDLRPWQSALAEVISAATEGSPAASTAAAAGLRTLAEILGRAADQSQGRPDAGPTEVKGRGSSLSEVAPCVRACLDCLLTLQGAGRAEINDDSPVPVRDGDVGELAGSEGGGDWLVGLMELGKAWVHLGLLEAHLLAPRGPVDPAEKKALKLHYVKREIADISNELRVHSLSCQLLTGRSLQDLPASQVTERLQLAKQRLASLEERAPELAKETAYRPDPPQFDALLQDTTLYLNSIGSRSTVEGLLGKMGAAFGALAGEGKGGRSRRCPSQKALREETAWRRSQSQFLRRLGNNYPLYRDQWAGLVAAASLMQYGMRLAGHALLGRARGRELGCRGAAAAAAPASPLAPAPARLLAALARFPGPPCPATQLVSPGMLGALEKLAAYSAGEPNDQAHYQRMEMSLLQIALDRARSHALLSGRLDAGILRTLMDVLDAVASSWRRAAEAARLKEAAEASLYKYKAKTHGDGLTDQQREEREFRRSFPSFEKDFADLTAEPTLERRPEMEDSEAGEEKDGEGEDGKDGGPSSQLTPQQMSRVCAVHRQIFARLTRTEWLKPSGQGHGPASGPPPSAPATSAPVTSAPVTSASVTSALKDGYGLMVQLSAKALPFLDPSLDKALLGSHLVMIKSLQSALAQSVGASGTGGGGEERPRPYDVYHDANVAESVRCRPVLERLAARISQLLEQWPEHPTLKQLVLLIERILEFAITSPLMKFVTGLEILLEKAQEWESNASRAVSIREHLEDITDQVIEWRKLELRCWSSCLDTVAYRLEQGTNKWWFHIYQLLRSYLRSGVVAAAEATAGGQDGRRQEEDGDAAAGTDGSEKEEEEEEGSVEADSEGPETAQSLLAALEQFMEGASLGEFASRLQLLRSFHCQVALQPRNPRQREVASMLWNLHCYYGQFLAAVQAEIKIRRTPIEKELKGFVKIARWNDISFWAVKLAVEKSHKTLHKFSKKFETELRDPAKCAFTDSKMAEKEDVSTEGSAGTRPSSFDAFLTPDDYKVYIEDGSLVIAALRTERSLHGRLASLLPRMTKLCRTVFKRCPYPDLVTAVDELTGEIVSGVKELQSLDVTKDADKEKQKAQIRRIQQRKRKALADLFRYLGTIGLSYRKGLALMQSTNQNEAMMLPPIDLAVALETEDKSLSLRETETVAIWAESQRHFVKSIARGAAMQMALAVPSKELGVGNIERCKGFAEHLSLLAVSQRHGIIDLTEGLTETRHFLSQLQRMRASAGRPGDDPSALPPQRGTERWVAGLKELMDGLRETSAQYLTLLDACPEAGEGRSTEPASPLPRECLVAVDTVRKGDALWTETRAKLQESQGVLEKVNQRVEPRMSQLAQEHHLQLLFWDDAELLDDAFDELESVSDAFADVEQLFAPPEGGARSCLANALADARQRLLAQTLEYRSWRRWLVCQGGEDAVAMETEMPDDPSEMVQDFANRTETVLASVLLAVQTVVKAGDHAQPDSQEPGKLEPDAEPMEEQDAEDQVVDLQDGHLVRHLSDALGRDAKALDLVRVSKVMGSLLQDIKDLRDSANSAEKVQDFRACAALLLRLVPVLHQYLGLVSFTLGQTVACHQTTCRLLSVLLGIFTELAAKGFCLPAEYSDEVGGEGATDFQDIEGGGVGEGEGMKDVSDQIENEEQVQDTKKPGDKEKEEDFSNEPDVKDEEQGIEMSEDFQGKLHDGDGKDGEEDEEEEDEEHEMEKQMGEVDQPDADKLDERMWGDQEDEEEEEGKEGEKKKEEFGEGKGEDKRTEMVAKDDNQGASEDKDEERQGKEEEEEEGRDNKEHPNPENLEPQDEGDFNDDQVDPRKANDPPEAPVPEDLDIPDDLALDGGKMDEEEEEEGGPENQDETNPFDIETKLPDEKESGANPEEDEGKEDNAGDEEGESGNQEPQEQEGRQGEEEEEKEDGEGNQEEEEEEEGKDAGMRDAEGEDGGDEEEDGEQKGGVGIEPQEDDEASLPEESDADYQPDQAHHPEAMPEPAENYGKSQEKTEVAMDQTSPEDAGKTEDEKSKEKENVGTAESSLKEGHEGALPSQTMPRHSRSEQRQAHKRRPGQTDAERSLGSAEERVQKRLRTLDAREEEKEQEPAEDNEGADQNETSDLYEHLKDATSHYDAQTMDAASEDQAPPLQGDEDEDAAAMETDEEELRQPDDEPKEEREDSKDIEQLTGNKVKAGDLRTRDAKADEPDPTVAEGEGEEDGTASGAQADAASSVMQSSTIHTTLDLLSQDAKRPELMTVEELEVMRREMEQQLSVLSQKQGTADEAREAQETWHRYESLTSGLARDLCEQLRLVLEPTQASKLRGDFRTGKRINMRKVIPYIASGFRKDKIWLRRTKPSKRHYQILLAVDDSSSMADNRSRQLAFESLAVISNALTWLEAGELAVCSFGESVQLLHPFHEQFTDQSGARILRQFTFSQTKTKIAQLLTHATASMVAARPRLSSSGGAAETAQLLLVLSDGRGLFLEGMEAVRAAVRRARDANIFLVFVALDNPQSKDSILDIKVPIFGGPGELPQISTYMEHFPFPFYIILKDINSMPEVLSDALRQWFELVTAGDLK